MRINKAVEALGKEISPYVYNKETLGFRLDSTEEIAVFRDSVLKLCWIMEGMPGERG